MQRKFKKYVIPKSSIPMFENNAESFLNVYGRTLEELTAEGYKLIEVQEDISVLLPPEGTEPEEKDKEEHPFITIAREEMGIYPLHEYWIRLAEGKDVTPFILRENVTERGKLNGFWTSFWYNHNSLFN